MQAAEVLARVTRDEYRHSVNFVTWHARAHIMAGTPEAAWRLYVQLPSKCATAAFALLRLIADECYGMGHFLYSAKAFQARPILLVPPATGSPLGCHCYKSTSLRL